MRSDLLNEKLETAYKNLQILDDFKSKTIVSTGMNNYGQEKFIYEIDGKKYLDEYIYNLFHDAILVVDGVNKLSADDAREIMPNLTKLCAVINEYGKNFENGNYGFNIVLEKKGNSDKEFVVGDIITSYFDRCLLLEALDKIKVLPNKEEGKVENVRTAELMNDKIHEIKLSVIETFINDKGVEFGILNGKSSTSLYNIIKHEFERGEVSKTIEKVLNESDIFVRNYANVQVKTLMNIKTAPKIYKKKLKSALSDKKKDNFKHKINETVSSLKSRKISFVAIPLVAGAVLAGGYHGSCYVVNEIQSSKNLDTIAQQIKENAGYSDFKCSAISAEEIDGKYFVEIYGFGIKEGESSASLQSVAYEIDKELYQEISENYSIEFSKNENGDVIGAKNTMKKNIKVIDDIKSNRVRWDVNKKLVEETESTPDFVGDINDSITNE